MAGTSRKTGARIRARLARIAAIGVIAALATIFTPGTASATVGVAPIVDCYRDNGDGTFWIVLGYENTTGRQQIHNYGTANQVYPTRLQGQQPKQFAAGTVHGAWTVRLSYQEIFYQDARWILNGQTLRYSYYVQYATVCPPTTQLPADGNGTGTAVALGAAGVVGAAMLYRFRRRLARLTGTSPSADAAA
ncbi:hypothetical protein [Blastococcus sp. TF02A-26]|uniref:hypothetical protein n=1 Tax=Blastococcus sp. TF02A-26 TaxID=2250577 RepID=UPI000DEB6452|nr:hypothetical protein [Blastococcus sp. TF02A-26]RBY84249.1 hypothetical protein DQ240_15545 [Blastococcus sp. TF02A-26]